MVSFIIFASHPILLHDETKAEFGEGYRKHGL